MGILDGYQFDPQTFAGNGGILAQLAQQFGLPNQNQVQPGFPDAGQPDTRYAQGVDMLRGLMGGGQQQAQLPPTSTPTAGMTLPQMADAGFGRDQGAQGPLSGLLSGIGGLFSGGASPAYASAAPGAGQQQGGPPPPAAAGPGLLDRLSAGANSLEGGNPIAALINSIGGLATGQRNDVRGQALQNQEAVYQALVPALMAKGASFPQAQALARSASTNPEILKTVSTTLYQAPSLVSGGTNPLTGEITHQVYNPNNQTLANLAPTAQGGGAANTLTPANARAIGMPVMSNNQLAQIQDLNTKGLTGDEYYNALKAISQPYADKIKGMSRGDIPYPTGFVMKTPLGDLLTNSVSALKPGVTAQDYASIQAAQKAWTTGPDAAAVKSANQAITHADKAWKLIDRLPNLNVGGGVGQVLNYPWLQGNAALSPQYASDKQEYDKLVQALSGELMTASRGSGHGSLEEIRSWKKGAIGASSPAEMRGSIRGAMDFLEGATEALATKKTNAFRGRDQLTASDLLEPGQKQKFDKIRQSTEGGPQQSQQPQQPQQPSTQAGAPLDQARAAIKAGAPRDAVIKRLRDNGIDPAGI